MKQMLKAFALSLLLMSGSLLQNTATAQYYDEDREVSYQTFYDELSPHGRWVDYPSHGYVWVPDAGPDFRPYSTGGHWVWTDNYEWMWVSDYDWGWAPFHYGRWDYDPYYGWYWVPGYEWSSAWVAWRDGGDYYGWAPIRPGISISINFNIGGYRPPVDFWCFAPRRYITSPRIYDYYVPRHNNVTIINQTTIIINNYNYGGSYGFRSGPRRYDAERYCGRINPVRFRDSYNPGRTTFRNNEVSVYRPRVQQDNNRQFQPRNFERYDRNSNTGFRRNDNNANNNGSNNGSVDRRRIDREANNEQPQRQPQQPERRIEPRQQPNNNGSVDRRRIDREANNEQPQRPQPIERRIEPRQQPNNNGSVDRRRIDRNANNEQPQRQPQQVERRVEPRPQQPIERRQQQPQQMERRQQQPQQVERRVEPRPQQQVERRQQQPQQMERRQQQPQQVERRQQPQPQPQQQPTRQIERKQQSGNDNGSGNGKGKKQRF